MPSERSAQTEKPIHYTYLKEFRVDQCPLFLQHKCTQHRPFTCFYWHFMNQRRRRPVRKRDGTFNYSPDVYCTKFDETSGLCPDGDECPYLHRTAGDTERRYHLRYYKTGMCVYDTDQRGFCVKNGPHCAFAHGAHDLRPPVYDIRELQGVEVNPEENGGAACLVNTVCPNSLDKERSQLAEDAGWQDTNFVLAHYKTEPCKRPPRLCRQGYACPQYHNSRDRRRSPMKFKYRSTPCPNVKFGDEWGEPSNCENGEKCQYCHTRTEQQFHPEIYKSTKCNDMQQKEYCPRGSFCAFAHVDQEMTTHREMAPDMSNNLATILSNVLPPSTKSEDSIPSINNEDSDDKLSQNDDLPKDMMPPLWNSFYPVTGKYTSIGDSPYESLQTHCNSFNISLPTPIGKPRSQSCSSMSVSESAAQLNNLSYQKAPGSEREDRESAIRKQINTIDSDISLDVTEKTKRKHNLYLLHNMNNVSLASTPPTPSSSLASAVSPLTRPYYPTTDTVESVVGNALEDLSFEEINIEASIDKDLDNDSNSVSSSLSTGITNSGILGSSAPVNIPGRSINENRGSITSQTVSNLSPPSASSPLSIMPPGFHLPQARQEIEKAAATYLNHASSLHNTKFGSFHGSAPQSLYDFTTNHNMSPSNRCNTSTMSPISGSTVTPSSLLMNTSFSITNGNNPSEIQKLREELISNRAKLASWEESMTQARNACEAWKREAEEARRQRDEALKQVLLLQKEVEPAPFLHKLASEKGLNMLPLNKLKQMQQIMKKDLDTLDKVIYQHTAAKCMICKEQSRSVALTPCNHYVLCNQCAPLQKECPYCYSPIDQRTAMVMPL
ncbi:RING finger protein unkempt [Nymphon striatum]|nr:RING finger protein unkempt [Nymphon striatum]